MNRNKPHIVLCVTNDLRSDKRMRQTAKTLVGAGARVTMIGRGTRGLPPLKEARSPGLELLRLPCIFKSGPLFYLEYNLRLFVRLLRLKSPDKVTACDPDTLPGVLLARMFRRFEMIYDSHEYFTEVPELLGHPVKQKIWQMVERRGARTANRCYTVNEALREILSKRYDVPFEVVYNFPERRKGPGLTTREPHSILRLFYQGVLNEGRGLLELVRSMAGIDAAHLTIIGEGVMLPALEAEIRRLGLEGKVSLTGFVPPEQLYERIGDMDVSCNLLEARSLNYYYSTGNKFFDAVQLGIPQIAMDFPEYRRLNEEHEVALLIRDLSETAIRQAVEQIRAPQQYQRLAARARVAAEAWHWSNNEAALLDIYGLGKVVE